MQEKKYFGTDGIRGRVGSEKITPDFILRLGYAAGKVLCEKSPEKLFLIGKDTRLSGYIFESALEAGLAAAGVDVALLGPMPTPAISYLTKTLRATAGIVISASHNCYKDNGIKFFSSTGHKLTLEQELSIEEALEKNIYTINPCKLGKISRTYDAAGRYIEFCKSTLPYNINLNNINLVLDCANGATYNVAPKIFQELGANVTVIHNNPNGININENCGSTDITSLKDKVKECSADLGIAFDGDGDRVIMVDNKGNEVDGDQILYIIAKLYKKLGKLQGGVVGTIMSNLGLEHSLKKLGIIFIRTKVGDKFIQQELEQRAWNIGGESSGHIICKDKILSGDGIVASLNVLYAMYIFATDLNSLTKEMISYTQLKYNIPCKNKEILKSEQIKEIYSSTEYKLSQQCNARVVLRASGTEPVVRLMAEGDNKESLERGIAPLRQALTDLAVHS